MRTNHLGRSLSTLLEELLHGAPEDGGFVLNPGDRGMLRSLDGLSGAQASASVNGGASVAAHVAHVRYGLSLMNRWAAGEETPFVDADWGAAWEQAAVSDEEWASLRRAFLEETDLWQMNLRQPRELADVRLDGIIASIVHLAYHLGAIRQIEASARGPRAGAPSAG